jgi:hypothetical protein
MILGPLLALFLGAASPPGTVQELRFANGDVTLGGLVRLPSGPPPYPAVVLLPGSLATAKEDERLAAVAAAFLARGFAAMTTDSRGTGASQGDFHAASLEVLAGDAAAAAAMLEQRPDVRADAVGFWGVSQGATWVGPLAAERSRAAFLVAASGPLLSPQAFMHRFFAGRLRSGHQLDQPTIERIAETRAAVWSYLATGNGYEAASAAVAALRGEPWFAASGLPPHGAPTGRAGDSPGPHAHLSRAARLRSAGRDRPARLPAARHLRRGGCAPAGDRARRGAARARGTAAADDQRRGPARPGPRPEAGIGSHVRRHRPRGPGPDGALGRRPGRAIFQ